MTTVTVNPQAQTPAQKIIASAMRGAEILRNTMPRLEQMRELVREQSADKYNLGAHMRTSGKKSMFVGA